MVVLLEWSVCYLRSGHLVGLRKVSYLGRDLMAYEVCQGGLTKGKPRLPYTTTRVDWQRLTAYVGLRPC